MTENWRGRGRPTGRDVDRPFDGQDEDHPQPAPRRKPAHSLGAPKILNDRHGVHRSGSHAKIFYSWAEMACFSTISAYSGDSYSSLKISKMIIIIKRSGRRKCPFLEVCFRGRRNKVSGLF
jgi:hypothetical protein